MPYYLDGYKSGYEVASWLADLFFPNRGEVHRTSDGKNHLVAATRLPPENLTLQRTVRFPLAFR